MNGKAKQTILAIAMLLIAGVAVGVARSRGAIFSLSAQHAVYYCPMHPSYTSDRPGSCPICNMALVKRTTTGSHKDICYLHNCPMARNGQPCPMLVVAKQGERVDCPICKAHVAEATQTKKILYWTDPMLPGYKAQGPGKSPMGMDLVPVYEEEQPAGASASPAGYASILVTPQKQQLIGVTTALVQRRELTKTIRTVGVVAHDPELYQAEQEFIQAYQSAQQAQQSGLAEVATQAQRMLGATTLRLRHLGLSDAMLEEMKTWTQPDERLLVGGIGQHWVYASVYEYEMPSVRSGQSATITSASLPGRSFAGVVKAIDPLLDPATRSARARIVIDDPGRVLAPGMYVDVAIAVSLGEVPAVPQDAVMATGAKHIVFVDKGQGLFEPRDVIVGMKADGFYAVQSGLAEGEVVVTSGNFLIDSESRLQAALQNFGSSSSSGEPASGEPPHGQ